MTEKIVNYTQDQVAQMVQDYQAGSTVEAIAEALGKSVRSVVAKLSREGVYQPKTRAKGAARVTKAALIQQLEAAGEFEAGALASLEKASHDALELLAKRWA